MAEYGREITESEAHDYVERCKLYKDSLVNGILGPHLNGPPGDLKNCAIYYNAKTNGWIFDAELVKQLLADSDAKYFAVFLGATIDMDAIVVLTGLKEKSASEPTKLLAAAKKIEQPKLFDNAKFPNSANGPIDLPG